MIASKGAMGDISPTTFAKVAFDFDKTSVAKEE
jgi:hypothetical protein